MGAPAAVIRNETAYAVDPESGLELVLDALAGSFAIRAASVPAQRLVYYDTLDGRLHRGGSSLALRGAARLEAESEDVALSWTNGTSPALETLVREPFEQASELPEGALRDAVTRVVAGSRLSPLLEVDLRGPAFDLLDDEEKTVVRLRLEEGRARAAREGGDWHELPAVLRAESVRGYEREWAEAVGALSRRPELTTLSPDGGSGARMPVSTALGVALFAIGARGASAPAFPRLDAGIRADECLKRVLAAQLEIVRANESGVRAALDIEFLHDFRVAVRRSRALLGQLDDVLPATILERFLPELSWLGTVTGPLRDLDVLVDDLDELARGVAASDIAPLREFLRIRREEAHARLVRALDSPRYAQWVEAWSRYLDEPLPPVPAQQGARLPLRDVAAARILRLHRRVLKRGRKVDDDSPARTLHKVRLDCKKLRYVVDASSSLFDEDAVAQVIRVLKRFQDNLGTFNDCTVQGEALGEFARRMREDGRAPVGTLLAMGRTIERAAARAEGARAKFRERFDAFAAKDNKRRFRELFGEGCA